MAKYVSAKLIGFVIEQYKNYSDLNRVAVLNLMQSTIDAVPCDLLNAVEIVCCKDCTFARSEMTISGGQFYMCKHTETIHGKNHFCSYGRKEDGKDVQNPE